MDTMIDSLNTDVWTEPQSKGDGEFSLFQCCKLYRIRVLHSGALWLRSFLQLFKTRMSVVSLAIMASTPIQAGDADSSIVPGLISGNVYRDIRNLILYAVDVD